MIDARLTNLHKFNRNDFIAEYQIENVDHKFFSHKIDEIKSDTPTIVSNVKAWHYGWDLHKEIVWQPIIKVIEHCARNILSIYNMEKHFSPIVHESWCIDYRPLDYTLDHDHFPATLACSYYIDADEDTCPPLSFPFIKAGDVFEISPKTGTLILFPGIYTHHVKAMSPFKNITRKVLAANIFFIPNDFK